MSAIIFNGKNAKLLTSGDLVNGDKQTFAKYIERNYILNHSGAVDTTGWASSGGAMTLTRVTSGVPRLSLGYGLQFAAGAASDYQRFRFTVDPADYSKKLKIQFDMVPGSYTTGDMKVDLFATTDSTYATGLTRQVLSPTDSASITSLPNLTGTFRTSFDAAGASGAIYCELRIVRVTGTSTLTLSDIVVGPGVVVQGATVTTWQSYTPTWSSLSGGPPAIGNGTVSGQYRRVGDTLEIEVAVNTGTATTYAGTNYTFTIPSGFTVNTGALGTSGGVTVALGSALAVSSTTYYPGVVVSNGGSTYVGVQGPSSTGWWGSAAPFAWAASTANQTMSIRFTVPVNELVGSGTVNVANNDEEYAFNTDPGTTANASFSGTLAYGQGGTAINAIASTTTTGNAVTSYVVQFQRSFSSSDRLILEVLRSSSNIWEDVNGTELRYLQQGTASYGLGLYRGFGSTNQVLAQFGNAGAVVGATYGAAGTAWSTYTGYKWRVRKQGGVGTVGYGTVVPGSSAGLVSASGVPGNATGNAIASQFVGEMPGTTRTGAGGNAYSTRSTTAPNGTYAALVSLTLNIGVYLVAANMQCVNTGGAMNYSAYLAVGGTQVTNAFTMQNIVNDTETLSFPMIPVVITANGTAVAVYAKDLGTGPDSAVNELWAVRVA